MTGRRRFGAAGLGACVLALAGFFALAILMYAAARVLR